MVWSGSIQRNTAYHRVVTHGSKVVFFVGTQSRVCSPSCHTTNQRIPPCATDTKSVLPAGSHWQDLVGERECFAGILVETVDVVRPFPDLLSFEIKHSGNGRTSIEGHPGSVNKGEVVIHLHWQTIMRNREHQNLSAQRGRSHAISRNSTLR